MAIMFISRGRSSMQRRWEIFREKEFNSYGIWKNVVHFVVDRWGQFLKFIGQLLKRLFTSAVMLRQGHQQIQLFLKKMQKGQNLFLEMAVRVSKLSTTSHILEYQESRFELKSFQIEHLSPQKAVQTYHRIQKRYQCASDWEGHSEEWLESEKRLYAWFIVYFTYFGRDYQGIKIQIDFTALSRHFFRKKAEFLEFHFLTMLKTSQKGSWDQEKDELLLRGFQTYGMRWIEISRSIFMVTNKEVFRSPKCCRERWLNHLDKTKVRGNWSVDEDKSIFEFVLQEGKKWSKLVGVLKDKRTEHSIKNRYNALIAKYRKYRMEKEAKVAARVLKHLLDDVNQDPQLFCELQIKVSSCLIGDQNNAGNDSQQIKQMEQLQQLPKVQARKIAGKQQSNFEANSPQFLYKIQNISQEKDLQIQNYPQVPQQNPEQKKQTHSQPAVAQGESNLLEANPYHQTQSDLHYPFQNYSYEMEIYNYTSQIYEFHKNQMLFYQQLYTIAPMTTADTSRTERQTKLMQQRRRNKQAERSNRNNQQI